MVVAYLRVLDQAFVIAIDQSDLSAVAADQVRDGGRTNSQGPH